MFVKLRLLIAFALILTAGSLPGQPPDAARPLQGAFRTARSAERRAAIIRQLASLGPEALEPVRSTIETQLARLEAVIVAPPDSPASEEVVRMRKVLADLRADPELSSDALHKMGEPALQGLRQAHSVREREVARHYQKLVKPLEEVHRWRALFEALKTSDGIDAPAGWDVAGWQRRADALAERTARGDLPERARVAAANAKVAPGFDPQEAAGIAALNETRVVLGLNPLIADPKLVEAARGHSADMKNLGFFAHESPVPGKTTPWDRAKQAGTTASGENIFVGSGSANSALKAWFFSPGHHKIMFGEAQRVGLGRADQHWTLMTGG